MTWDGVRSVAEGESHMEILFVVLVLTALLTLAPARSRGERSPATPAAICRYVDVDELRSHWLPARPQVPRTAPSLRSMPTLEQDFVETVACESARLIASTRNGLLFIRTEASEEG